MQCGNQLILQHPRISWPPPQLSTARGCPPWRCRTCIGTSAKAWVRLCSRPWMRIFATTRATTAAFTAGDPKRTESCLGPSPAPNETLRLDPSHAKMQHGVASPGNRDHAIGYAGAGSPCVPEFFPGLERTMAAVERGLQRSAGWKWKPHRLQ